MAQERQPERIDAAFYAEARGDVRKTLNHDQAHDWLPTLDPACAAPRSEHHHLDVSARQTFGGADLRADSPGRWSFPALTELCTRR